MHAWSSVRTERIVDAAAQLFARRGYHATSTREIARLAGVSENTLFRHFDRKENLFWSTLRSRMAALNPKGDLLSGIRAGDAPAVVLPQIFELLTDTVCRKPEVSRLFAVALLELQEQAEALCEEFLSPLLSEICQYLAKSIAKREVLEVDPSLLAGSFLAMVLIHPQVFKLTADRTQSPIDSRGAVLAYSRFWLDLLHPRFPSSSVPQTISTSLVGFGQLPSE